MTPMMNQPGSASAAGRRGFTLIELMISIALVVLLLLGINQIFKMSSDTIGTGQTFSAMVRDARAVQSVMEQDAGRWATNAPLFYIRSDQIAGRRSDRLAFPVQGGPFRRQTGDVFSSSTSSLEAWVWYGHGVVPNGKQDLLCRMAMLLKDPATISDPDGAQYIVAANSPVLALARTATGGGYNIRNSRYDLAGMTLEQLRSRVTSAELFGPADWWRDLEYAFECDNQPGRPLTTGVLQPNNPGEKLARAVPALLDNCKEFIVEFAGDFFTQDNDGRAVAVGPDGILDYVVVNNNQRRIRWYGLPRDIDQDGQIDWRWDVVPAVALRVAGENLGNTFLPFEREVQVPTNGPNWYTCVWTNQMPAMVRVLMRVEDPSARIQDPQWFEYVLRPQ